LVYRVAIVFSEGMVRREKVIFIPQISMKVEVFVTSIENCGSIPNREIIIIMLNIYLLSLVFNFRGK